MAIVEVKTTEVEYTDRFCVRLGEALEKAGLSATRLSQITGVSAPTITNWLRCERKPNLGKAAVVARALGLSIDKLCGLNDE